MVRASVRDLEVIASSIANIKEVDLMEIFREITILNSLIKYNYENPNMTSQGYIKYSLENEVMSSSEYMQNCNNKQDWQNKVVYLLFGK